MKLVRRTHKTAHKCIITPNQGEGADSEPRRCEGPKFSMVCCGPAQSLSLNILPSAFNHFKKKNWITPKPCCGQNT